MTSKSKIARAVTLLAVALVAGCGDDGGPPFPVQRFETPESVVRALALAGMLPLIEIPTSEPATIGPPSPRDVAQCFAAQAMRTQACEDGGTVRTSEPREVTIDSPYADEPFVVTTRRYDHCLVVPSCFGTRPTETTGTTKTGCPASQWNGTYCAPHSPDAQVSYDAAGSGDASFTVKTWFMGADQTRVVVEHTEDSVVHSTGRSVFVGSIGEVAGRESFIVRTYSGSSQAGEGPIRRYRGLQGTPDHPFLASSSPSGRRISGPLGYSRDDCEIGAFTVETVEDIVYGTTPFDGFLIFGVQSGFLRLSGARRSATARMAEGDLVVTDAQGRKTTYTKGGEALRAAIEGCRDLFPGRDPIF